MLFACVVVVIVYGIIVIRSDPTDDFVRVYRECVKEDRSFPVSINTFCSLCHQVLCRRGANTAWSVTDV